APRRLQQTPGSFDVRLERGQRTAVGDADDRLRCEVEDGLDLVLGEDALQAALTFERAVDDVDTAVKPGTHQLRAVDLVADEADDVSALLKEQSRRPGADESRAAGDEDAPVAPESFRRGHAGSSHRVGVGL